MSVALLEPSLQSLLELQTAVSQKVLRFVPCLSRRPGYRPERCRLSYRLLYDH